MSRFRSHAGPGDAPDPKDAVNDALERLVRGDRGGADRLDPGMRATIDQLYAWADESNFRAEALPPPAARPWRFAGIPRLSLLSGIAAALLVGVMVYGVVLFFDGSRDAPAPDVLEVASGGTATALLTPFGTPDVSALAPADCAREPRSPGEILDILATPPAPGAARLEGGTAIATAKNDELDPVLRGWQACLVFGDTLGAMAYESEQYLREDLYGSPRKYEPYIEAWRENLLSARMIADDNRTELFEADKPPLYVVDPSVPATLSATGDWIRVGIVPVSPGSDEHQGPSVEAVFVVEDGRWHIRTIEKDIFDAGCVNVDRSGRMIPCSPAASPKPAD